MFPRVPRTFVALPEPDPKRVCALLKARVPEAIEWDIIPFAWVDVDLNDQLSPAIMDMLLPNFDRRGLSDWD